MPRDDDGGGGGSSGRPTSSSSSNSSSGSGNGRPGYSASSVFDLSDGDVPSAFTAVGPISVKANMQLLRLADYGSAQQTHLYGDLRSLVRLDDDAADPDKVSMSFKIKVRAWLIFNFHSHLNVLCAGCVRHQPPSCGPTNHH